VQRWLFKRELERLDPGRVYYLDECGIDRRLYRERARAPRGKKVYQCISGKRTRRINVVGAWKDGRLVAPMVFEESCNTALINAYFEQVLLPALPSGSVVVLDNASFHRAAQTAQLAAQRGVELMFLPSYSPDLNPIEHFWATLKRALRKVLPTSSNPKTSISDMCLCYC